MTYKGYFTVDVYDCTVFITVSDNILRSINATMKGHGDDSITEAPSGYAYRPGTGRIGKLYMFFDSEDLSVDIVNHEKSHLIEYILNDRGIRARDEVRSYLDGFVSHKIDAFFKKRKLRIKNKR